MDFSADADPLTHPGPLPKDRVKKPIPDGHDWYCINGGADRIAERMAKKLQRVPVMGAYVTKIESTQRRHNEGDL